MQIGVGLSLVLVALRRIAAGTDTTNDILLESGSFLLLESGDKLLLEA